MLFWATPPKGTYPNCLIKVTQHKERSFFRNSTVNNAMPLVPRDPQLDCLARVLVLFTGSDPAGQTHTTMALIDAPTWSTAVLYLASEPFKPLLFSHGEQIFPGEQNCEQKCADMGLPR